jgi:spermidine/putrescine-binding protein
MRQRGTRVRLGSAVAAALLVAACAGGTSPQETGSVTLQVMNFANYMPEDIGERFKAATGHDIEVTLTSSNEDAIAKLEASPPGTYDLAFITNPFAEGLNKAGRLEALDHTKIPNLSNLYPEATEIATPATRSPSRTRGVPPASAIAPTSSRRPRSTRGTISSSRAQSSPARSR